MMYRSAFATRLPLQGNGSADKEGRIDTNTSNIFETLDSMWDGLLTLLPNIVLGTIVFVVFWFIGGFARRMIHRYTADRRSANLGIVLGRLAQGLLLLAGLLVATAIVAPSVKPADLLAGLGIGGVAIGFAFKDILQNFLSGVLILLREPFQIGDQIVSGEFEGTVDAIETRATLITTYDGKRVVIPNSQIYTNPVVVNTAFKTRRSQYDVGISYDSDLKTAAEAMLKAIDRCDGVVSEPAPDVLVIELADSSVNLRCRWWTEPDQSSVMSVRNQVVSAVKSELDLVGIEIPFPVRTVLYHDKTDGGISDQ